MKKLLFSLVVFSVLFIIGCQENTITDPIQTESTNKIQSPEETFIRGSILLDRIILFPGPGNIIYNLEGQINYSHRLVMVDPLPPATQQYVNLRLSINALLINPDLPRDNTYAIVSQSVDIVNVAEEGMYILEKTIPVQGRTDGLVLMCRFIVTTDGVTLNEMWLSFGDISLNHTIPTPGDTLTYPPVVNNNEF
ncbi:MAG: hypothetical protein IPJ03_02915 [Ignavibacteriales bacterium]|nr:hypothetical protein [Ignavibacteriales bacterium]